MKIKRVHGDPLLSVKLTVAGWSACSVSELISRINEGNQAITKLPLYHQAEAELLLRPLRERLETMWVRR
jgi:hypothetical protein